MPQLTERNQSMQFIIYIYRRIGFPLSHLQCMKVQCFFLYYLMNKLITTGQH